MKLKVTIDGKTYEVDVEASEPETRREYVSHGSAAPRPVAAAPIPKPNNGGEAVADETKVCRSPIAGLVVKVPTQVGQTIQANDVLIILEAMKMETTITSNVAGKVAKVNVAIGDAVQSGQVLVEFE